MEAFIKILISFIVVVFLLYKKINLGYCLLAGAIILGVLFRIPFNDFFLFTFFAFKDSSNQSLLVTLFFILILANIMGKTRQLERIVSITKTLVKNPKIVLAAMPAFIGFLPMPGGALFSAPLIEKTDEEEELSPSARSFINYWFRHVWEYFFPLYPGVILATTISGIKVPRFILLQLPFSLVAITIGFLFMSRLKITAVSKDVGSDSWRELLIYVLPVVIPIVSILIGLFPWLSIFLGVLTSIIISTTKEDMPVKEIFNITFRGFSWDVLLNVVGVIVFKTFIEKTGSVTEIAQFFVNQSIPLIFLITILPFLVGLFSGITMGPIGITFPLIIPLIRDNFYSSVSLAYACGFMGVMLSPAHLCFVVSNQYFNADIDKVYRILFLPVVLIIITGLILYKI
ncbi:MAG: DUF401 family protein [bacterium]